MLIYHHKKRLKKVKEKPKVAKVDYTQFTNAELKEMLDSRNIEYNDRDVKKTLIELLRGG